eukprot:5801396-Prymnesium_polylepis.2
MRLSPLRKPPGMPYSRRSTHHGRVRRGGTKTKRRPKPRQRGLTRATRSCASRPKKPRSGAPGPGSGPPQHAPLAGREREGCGIRPRGLTRMASCVTS